MSSGASIRSYHQAPRYRPSYEAQTTPTAPSFDGAKMTTSTKSKPSFAFAETRSYDSRPSFESDSSSVRSWIDIKERKLPPPPLFLHRSNLHPKEPTETPVIEIIAPGPPRVESRLSSHSVDPESPQPITPNSPDFGRPSEEEIRRRRHEKVMRTLGERVPAELVYRGPKIPNVTVFPEPPSPSDSQVTPRGTTGMKLSRRGSFTLSAFPNLSSVTSTLTNHARAKSRDILGAADSPPLNTPTPLSFPQQNHPHDIGTPRGNTYRSTTYPRPERPATIYSPITFATGLDRPTSQAFNVLTTEEDNEYNATHTAMSRKEVERAAKLARRASLSTATFLPTSPLRDGFRDIETHSPRSPLRRPYNPEPSTPHDDAVDRTPRQRPESNMLSPLVFSRASMLPGDHEFTFTVSDEDTDETMSEERDDEDEDEDYASAGSRTPPQHTAKHMYSQSESGHGLLSDPTRSHTRSNPHLPLHLRPETPFQDSVVPIANSGYLTPSGWMKNQGNDMLQRKERRQGWSGEWNQGDMQDVIRKLRNLK
ncbi:hypothetical protein DXG01_016816 [Tephrocybe rancida]|nr:hypothetical protein DXG01_016816 [Tephrocybe rancida]